jgi:hypothetical protein
MYRALHGAIPLADLPKLTVATPPVPSTPLKSSVPLPDDTTVTVYVGMAPAPMTAEIVHLPGHRNQLTFGGITLAAPPDRHSIELHNHTDEQRSCTVTSSVPWLQPDYATAWLEPHGMLEVRLGSPQLDTVAGSAIQSAAVGTPLALAPNQLEGIALYLHVRGVDLPTRMLKLSMVPGLISLGVVACSSLASLLVAAAFHLSLLGFYGLNFLFLLLVVVIEVRRHRAKYP